jgi:hypothetical protein
VSVSEQRYDRDAERATLACMLQSRLVRESVRRVLDGRDFYEPAHEQVWDAFARLDREGEFVDPVTLRTALPVTPAMIALLPELAAFPVGAAGAVHYASMVRDWSMRRQLEAEATRTLQAVRDPEVAPAGLASSVATRFAALRDSGRSMDDVEAKTLGEVLEEPDDEPDWLIPGVLERRDRLILTGEEGLGKSHLLRQFGICAAAGLDPWELDHRAGFSPVKVMIFDFENTENQVRRAVRGLVGYATHYGDAGVTSRVMLRCAPRIDVTVDKELARLHQELDAQQPDLVIVGPLYRLTPKAVQTDDEAAPLLAALDTIRDRGAALLIEAHSGHTVGKGGVRDMRPRGSSALLGWPEFGYGMRATDATKSVCSFVSWRGNRSEREWPRSLQRADDGVRWIPFERPTSNRSWGA